MAMNPKSDAKETTKESAATSSASQGQADTTSQLAILTTPVILKRAKSKKKKKKAKYTRGTKGLQRLVLGLSRAAFRSSNSVAKGFQTFARQSRKSSRRRRDGLIRDSFRNASRGFSAGLSELGQAPGEVARRVSTRRVWRMYRVLTPLGR